MLKKIIIVLILLSIISCTKNSSKKEDGSVIKLNQLTQKNIEKLSYYFNLGIKNKEKAYKMIKEKNLIADKLTESMKSIFITEKSMYESNLAVYLSGEIIITLTKNNIEKFKIFLTYNENDNNNLDEYKEKYKDYPLSRIDENLLSLIVNKFNLKLEKIVTPENIEKNKKRDENNPEDDDINIVLADINLKLIENFETKRENDFKLLQKLINQKKEINKNDDKKLALSQIEPFVKDLRKAYKDFSIKTTYFNNIYTISIIDKKNKKIFISLLYKSKNKKQKDIIIKKANNITLVIKMDKDSYFETKKNMDYLIYLLDINSLKQIK